MAPLRGWAPNRDRLMAKAPFRHWNTMTLVAALRHDRIEAPWLLDGPMNGERFRVYVEKVLVPTLLPKYSPDLNPIEQVFAKLKHLRRNAAARTAEAVSQTIGSLLGPHTPQQCANYRKNSGYHQS